MTDDDCDGDTDGDAVDKTVWYGDGDGDGYGVSVQTLSDCELQSGYSGVYGDCDDDDAAVHPGAEGERHQR